MTSNLVRYVCAILGTLALTAGVSATVMLADGASEATAVGRSMASPSAIPNVSGRTDHWGTTMTGSTDQNGRQQRRGRKTARRPTTTTAAKTAAANSPRVPKRQDDDARQEIRFNTGICGRMQNDGTVPGPTRCQPGGDDRRVTRRTVAPPRVVLPRPQDVTWEQVRSETKNVIFPGLSVKVQPKGQTLVNMATIVYTEDSKVSTTTVTLLGFPVVVEATPISYTWDFGDGSPTVTTSTPGKPYPDAEITHKYLKRQGVGLTVTTNYAARFNVADTGWQYINGTVPITGPATLLQVREAIPVLVDPER
jgi:hypothetical protein